MEFQDRIPIKNIYYMLCYAWNVVDYLDVSVCGTDKFDNIYNLLGRILVQEVTKLVKRGLHKEYVEHEEDLSRIKGRICITPSINQMTMMKQRMVCAYDEYSENCLLNQIIKSTIIDLMHCSALNRQLLLELRKLSYSFNGVDYVQVSSRNFSQLHFNRNNLQYVVTLNVCKLLRSGLIANTADNQLTFAHFLDEKQRNKLYERFILEYYKREYPHLMVFAKQIPWNADGSIDMLPIMQSDIYIKGSARTLIIDAKFYNNMTQMRFEQHTIHSANIYQIFTYVKNEDKERSGNVSGMLLYAKTIEEVVPNQEYTLDGNRFSVRVLDLNQEFEQIKELFAKIIQDYIE